MRPGLRLYRNARALLRSLRALACVVDSIRLQCAAQWRWECRRLGQPHALPGELIVSLTSHPARFHTLAWTLKCLLTQSVRPDAVVLWICRWDAALVPRGVRALESEGLTIGLCDDLGAYKKLVPTLAWRPHAFVATADDDVYYHHDWLAELVQAYEPGRREILCHRAQRIALDPHGQPAPYHSWARAPRGASALRFPLGMGGVLYPPGSLHPDVTHTRRLAALAPTSDDAWAYWMARRNDWRFYSLSRRRFTRWPGSPAVERQRDDAPLHNDEQIAAMAAAYGFPPRGEPIERVATRPAA